MPRLPTNLPPNTALQRTRAAVSLQPVPGEFSAFGRRRAPLSLGPLGATHPTIMSTTIRPYALGDAPALFEAATESIPDVFPGLPWCHPAYRLDEAQAWVEKQVGAFARAEEFEFVIQSPSGRFLGGCGINLIDRVHLTANLGYWVRSSAVGQGVAPAAALLAAQWAFAHTDVVRLEIITAVEHTRSQRVAEKTGAARGRSTPAPSPPWRSPRRSPLRTSTTGRFRLTPRCSGLACARR